MLDAKGIRCRYEALVSYLDERGRRLFAAAEARAAGRGGIALVSEITGIAPSTIGRGLAELDGRHPAAAVDRVRRRGGGRKPATEKQPGLLAALKSLVEPVERGDPERPLRWVSKSYRHLAGGLRELGYSISYRSIGPLLASLGYSLQGNAKTREGSAHPDRDGQFEAIARQVSAFLATGEPVISVDTKKKEPCLSGCNPHPLYVGCAVIRQARVSEWKLMF